MAKNKSNTKWWIIGGIVLIVLVLFMWIGGTYNSLVSLDEGVNNAWGKVQTAYQRRADLIPGYIKTAQEALEFQQETLTQVTALRSNAQELSKQIQNAKTPEELTNLGRQLDGVVSQTRQLVGTQLNLQVERYPELNVESVLKTQDELAGTENRIKRERDLYNDAVKEINVKVRRFPSNIIAGWFGFEQNEYFAADEGTEQAPDYDELWD